MRLLLATLFAFTAIGTSLAETPLGEAKSLFDGKSLDGWRGRSDLWSVADGAIVGTTTEEAPIKENTFLIYGGELPSNFELTAKFMIQGGNSGIQYRSKVVNEEKFVVSGYQADIDAALKFAGINYEEKGRGILALRGESASIDKTGKNTKTTFGDAAEIGKVIKGGDWNDYRIVANGNHLQHYINGTLTSEVHDGQADKAATSGVIALQIHQGPPMVIKFKDLQIRPITKP